MQTAVLLSLSTRPLVAFSVVQPMSIANNAFYSAITPAQRQISARRQPVSRHLGVWWEIQNAWCAKEPIRPTNVACSTHRKMSLSCSGYVRVVTEQRKGAATAEASNTIPATIKSGGLLVNHQEYRPAELNPPRLNRVQKGERRSSKWSSAT